MTETLAAPGPLRMFVEYSPANLGNACYEPARLLAMLVSAGFDMQLVSEFRDTVTRVADVSDLPGLQAEDPSAINLYLER